MPPGAHTDFPHDRETSVSTSGGQIVHVVDDDDGVRTGFARLLRSAGIDVRAYPSADRFLDEVDSVAPGCVLLDITMPGISGPGALERLKGKRDLLPVIVVSARDSEAVHRLTHEVGARMFLRKPVDDQALLDAINWVTKGPAEA
jgi:FixJ family two-component response regulator